MKRTFAVVAAILVLVLVTIAGAAVRTAMLDGEITYPSAWPIKGGVATLGDDTYVILNTPKNQMRITSNGTDWTGHDKERSEVIMTDGARISNDADNLDTTNLKLVMFFPTEVRVIDLKNNRSYTYHRN
jgi:hypothetical protein